MTVAADRRVDRPAPRARLADDERDVLARRARGVARAAAAARTPPATGRRRAGPTCRGRGGGRSRPVLLPARGSRSGERLRERAARVPGRRVHDDAGGLVDDEEMLVLVRDRELGQGDRRLRGGRSRRLDRDLLAAHELVALRPGLAVHEHGAGLEQPLGSRHAIRPRAAPARWRSSRSPAASGGTTSRFSAWDCRASRPRFSLGEDERGEQDADADHDAAVRDVEGRPVAEVEEVGHEAEPHAVGEVREAAADHEAERHGQHGMAGAGAREVGEHPADRDRRDDDDAGRRVREEAERDSGVLDVPDRQRPDDVDAVAERQVAGDDVLRHLVGDDGRDRDRRQQQPLQPGRRERAARARERRQGIRRRADSHLELACRLVHRRSLRPRSPPTVAEARRRSISAGPTPVSSTIFSRPP